VKCIARRWTGALRGLVVLLVIAAVSAAAWAGPTVAIVRGEDPDKMLAEAIELLGGMDRFVKDGQKVVIKPNLTWQPAFDRWRAGRRGGKPRAGTDTEPDLVEALAKRIQATAECKLTIAEGTPASAEKMYEFMGYMRLAKKLGIELVDGDQGERRTVKVTGGAHAEYSMPVVPTDADVLIDVAVLKTHRLAGVTLGMKNLFGFLPMPKERFHENIGHVLCDLTTMCPPDLVIIDGRVAMEGQGPITGELVKMGILIVGDSVVATDAVGATVMGIDPRKVKHLRFAQQRGLGEIDLDKITVKGVPIKEVRRKFKTPHWNARVQVDSTDARLVKLIRWSDRAYKRGRGDSLRLRFESRAQAQEQRRRRARREGKAPGELEPEPGPPRLERGFSAHLDEDGKTLEFEIPYLTLSEEDRAAAVKDMTDWIHAHLDAEAETRVLPE